MARQIWGDHLNVVDTLASLGYLELRNDQPATAEPYFVEALQLARRVVDADSPLLIWLNAGYGSCLLKLGRYEQSERALLEVLAMEQARTEPDVAQLAEVAAELVALYEVWGRADDADAHRSLAQGATLDTVDAGRS